jgi:HK97 family phage major capsid protein/HK97 family phage prohead protease
MKRRNLKKLAPGETAILPKSAGLKERAYAKLVIKSIDEEQRRIEGVATTPTPDRYDDVVESMGAEFELPLPFLWQHMSSQPIGSVIKAKPSEEGIPVTIQMAKTDTPGTLKNRLDEAWESIKLMLVRGLSIGFTPIEYSYMEDTGGYRFIRWAWLELSAVTIPANAEATISTIKSCDRKSLLAVSGARSIPKQKRTVVRLAAVAVEGANSNREDGSVKISEQLKRLREAKLAKAARMEEIQKAAADGNRSKDDAEREEFNTLADEIDDLDDEIKDLRRLEKAQVVEATTVDPEQEEQDDEEIDVEVPPTGSVRRSVGRVIRGAGGRDPHVQTVALRKELPKGILFARFVQCMGAARGDTAAACKYAKRYNDTPHLYGVLKKMDDDPGFRDLIVKASVAGGTTTDATWAGPLLQYNQFAGDFIEFLRPQTIIGRFGVGGIPALRMVPFNVHIRGQTTGGAGYWVGQGKPKPLTKFDFEDVYLGFAKVANIAVLSEELLRFSNPSAEVLTRDALAASLIERLDIDFVDPTKAAVANVSPASITNGITADNSSGATAADVRADIATAMGHFIAENISPTSAVWIMPATIALRLSLLRNAFGQKEFPDITMNGGMFEGVPVITSQYMPSVTAGALVILVNASDIWLADDGAVTIDASREASLQMLDNPTNDTSTPTPTTMVSMFQTDSVALRAERYINWKRRRDAAVATLDQVVWTGG